MRAVRAILSVAAVVLTAPVGIAGAAVSTDHLVTAKSRFGNGSITAPVRHEADGWRVRLPGGHWVYCRRSCAETLRVETIDFFDANSAGSGQLTNECGIFGCLDLKYAQ